MGINGGVWNSRRSLCCYGCLFQSLYQIVSLSTNALSLRPGQFSTPVCVCVIFLFFSCLGTEKMKESMQEGMGMFDCYCLCCV